jgi:hypothetical protein
LRGVLTAHSVRLRLMFWAVALAVTYSIILKYTGRTLAWLVAANLPHPISCCDYVDSLLHTAGILLAAAPVATAAVLVDRRRAMSLGAFASAAATAFAFVWSVHPEILQLLWNSQWLFLSADLLKIAAAVPVLIWIIAKSVFHDN